MIMTDALKRCFAPLFQWFLIRTLRCGRIPKHVAIIADGARRFGRKYAIPVQENHEVGLYNCMVEMLDWCLWLGVSEYSILMYSFGNYHRPEDEVGHWIVVLRLWLTKLIVSWKTLKKKGIRLNFYGKFVLIPEDINHLMATLVLITKDNTTLTVNMAMGYTSKHELSTVARDLYSAVGRRKLEEKFLTPRLFNECLFAIENRPVDIIIRTSGFKRISNFLCWQACDGVFHFDNVLWPEFSKFNFIKALFYYQMSFGVVGRSQTMVNVGELSEEELKFLKEWKFERKCLLLKYFVSVRNRVDLKKVSLLNYESVYDNFKKVHPALSNWLE